MGWAATDVGRRRDHNEDSFLCNNDLGLYAVADGMGGHLGGERASHLAVEIFEREVAAGIALFGKIAPIPPAPDAPEAANVLSPAIQTAAEAAAALKDAVGQATRIIFDVARVNPELNGMGTTLTGAYFHGDRVTICHVGDSRAYLHRNGHARQLTEDHSWIQEQVRAGILSPDDILASRFRNIITRSVGFEPTVEPDLITLPVEAGDCFLFCSDGLSNYLTVEEIGQRLTGTFYKDAPRAFIDLANERGGDDNITCVVVYVPNTD